MKFYKLCLLFVSILLISGLLAACDEASPVTVSSTAQQSTSSSGTGSANANTSKQNSFAATATPVGHDNRQILKVWTQGWKGNSKAEDFLNKIIDNYHSLHPNFTLDWQDFGSDTPNKLSEVLSGDATAPDLILINPADMFNFASRNQLSDLDSLTSQDFRDKFVTSVWTDLRYDNTSFAVPWLATGRVSIINKNLWQTAGLKPEDLPKTFDDLNKNLATLRDKTPKDATVAWLKPDPLADFMMEGINLYEIGGDGKSRVAAFDNVTAEGRWEYYLQLRKSLYLAEAGINGSDAEALKLYGQGKLTMITDATSLLSNLKSQYPDLYNNTLVTSYPLSRGKVLPIQMQSWSIPDKSHQKALALDFLQYLVTPENELEFAKFYDTYVPTLKAALNDSYVTSKSEPLEEARSLIVQNFDEMRLPESLLPQPSVPSQRDNLINALLKAQSAAWTRQLLPKDALDQAAKTWNDLLK